MARKKKLGAGYNRRKDGRIEYRWTQDGKRFCVYGQTIEECEEKKAELKKAIEEGGYVKNRDVTLDAYFTEYERNQDGVTKGSTASQVAVVYKRISPELGQTKVREIERRQVLAFQESLRGRYMTSTVNVTMAFLSSLMKSAIVDGIISRNPCAGIKRLKRVEVAARDSIHRALTVEETNAFFVAAKESNSWYRNLYAFLLHTGMRVGEAAALKRSDIDYNKGFIHVRRTVTRSGNGYVMGDSPKSKSSKRDIPLTPDIVQILKDQEQMNRDMHGTDLVTLDGLIFTTLSGKMIITCSFTRDLAEIQEDAGIKHFGVHAFRDTFATRALESGMAPQTLKEILGHNSYSMTMDLYAHTMNETKTNEMQKVVVGIRA